MARTCYFVESRVLSRPGVSAYADSMFHGLAARHGASYPGLESNAGTGSRRQGDSVPSPHQMYEWAVQ